MSESVCGYTWVHGGSSAHVVVVWIIWSLDHALTRNIFTIDGMVMEFLLIVNC